MGFWTTIIFQHFGQSPLPAYEPAFEWENERSMIFGQRIPETPMPQYALTLLSLLNAIIVCVSVFFHCHIGLFDWFPNVSGGRSGLKISVKVLSLSFQAGLLGEYKFILVLICSWYLFNVTHVHVTCYSLLKVFIFLSRRAVLRYNVLVQ